MKKILKFIGIAAVASIVGFMFAGSALAAPDDLIVIFNPNPLFGAVNFLPGQSATAQIEIKNQSGMPKPVAIEAINVNDPDEFGDVLNLEIKEGIQTILNKSLTEFFNQGETFLSNLADNASTTYDLIVTFNSGAGNAYQGKVLDNFDILFGFQGEQTPITPPGQGGGGGGGGAPAGLIIFNEAEINVTATEATLTWQTNYLSTSRVIWGAASEAHVFNFSNPPNYGYANSTVDDLNKVTFHSVTLTGLTPGTIYYYRVISHASPDTLSVEHSFTTASRQLSGEIGGEQPVQEIGGVGGEQGEQTGGIGAGVGTGAGTGAIGGIGGEVGAVGQESQVAGETEGTQNGQVAGAQEGCQRWPWWLVIIAFVIYLILAVINYLSKMEDKFEKWKGAMGWIFAILLLVLPAVFFWFAGSWFWWIWLLVILFYLITLIAYFIGSISLNHWPTTFFLTLFFIFLLFTLRFYLC